MSYTPEVLKELQEHPLYPVLLQAIHQAVYGKGDRHGGGKTPFLDQDWVTLHRNHGRGFLTGQACKKIGEAAQLREGEAFVQEVLGGIVYAGMSLLKEQEKPREVKGWTVHDLVRERLVEDNPLAEPDPLTVPLLREGLDCPELRVVRCSPAFRDRVYALARKMYPDVWAVHSPLSQSWSLKLVYDVIKKTDLTRND